VVPRLIVGLTNDIARPPLGAEIWGDTWLSLADAVSAGVTYRNALTGETLRAGARDGHAGLPLATVLGYFPVALLERGA
jgi:(1->4)-alpha-D-glucan 1-alpha-D-glucosylmutase